MDEKELAQREARNQERPSALWEKHRERLEQLRQMDDETRARLRAQGEERRRALQEKRHQELVDSIGEILKGMTLTAGLTDAQGKPTEAGLQFLRYVEEESG